jgi:hypothetical protein
MESRQESNERWIRLGELESGLGGPYVGAGAVVEEPSRLFHHDQTLAPPPDEAIATAVLHLLDLHPAVLARELSVSVSSGVVSLRGVVDDEAMRVAAQELARTVPGTREVVNHLRIEHSSLDVKHRR